MPFKAHPWHPPQRWHPRLENSGLGEASAWIGRLQGWLCDILGWTSCWTWRALFNLILHHIHHVEHHVELSSTFFLPVYLDDSGWYAEKILFQIYISIFLGWFCWAIGKNHCFFFFIWNTLWSFSILLWNTSIFDQYINHFFNHLSMGNFSTVLDNQRVYNGIFRLTSAGFWIKYPKIGKVLLLFFFRKINIYLHSSWSCNGHRNQGSFMRLKSREFSRTLQLDELDIQLRWGRSQEIQFGGSPKLIQIMDISWYLNSF